MKGRWAILGLLAAGGATAAGVVWARNTRATAAAPPLPSWLEKYPEALHTAVMAQLSTRFPGAQSSFRDMSTGYRGYRLKTTGGIDHQIIYRADGFVHSQS